VRSPPATEMIRLIVLIGRQCTPNHRRVTAGFWPAVDVIDVCMGVKIYYTCISSFITLLYNTPLIRGRSSLVGGCTLHNTVHYPPRKKIGSVCIHFSRTPYRTSTSTVVDVCAACSIRRPTHPVCRPGGHTGTTPEAMDDTSL
jgi:hypothetical protein